MYFSSLGVPYPHGMVTNMKRTIPWTAGLLLLSVLLGACSGRPLAGTAVTATGSHENKSVPTDAILLYDGNAFTFELILSEHADSRLRRAVIGLAEYLQAASSSDALPTVKEDYLQGEHVYEILIGKTTRPTSDSAWRRLGADFRFSVEVGDACTVLVGSSAAETQKAVQYFTDCFLPEHLLRSGDRLYLCPGGYQSQAGESTFISYAVLRAQTEQSFFYTTQEVLRVPALGTYSIMQGACLDSDGIYAYFILRDTKDFCSMVKYDMRTGELVASHENIGCDHGNDMCYNEKNGTVVVSHCTNNPSMVSVFRADTLELVERKNLGFSNSAIGYNADRGQYVVMGEGFFRILNEDFQVVEAFPHRPSQHTSQGIHCDENYIYRVESASTEASGNILEIYDWNGNYVLKMELADIAVETETIFHFGSDLYVNCYAGSKKGGILYRLTMTP